MNKKDIERNFQHVMRGEALDMPLAVLDGELKKQCKKRIPNLLENARKKARMKAYNQQPEVKARKKAYHQQHKEEIKAYYQQHKEEIKAYHKAYYQNVTKPKREKEKVKL